jgi:hypothetical protein
MADTEWGWKKRSDDSNIDYDDLVLADEDTEVDKRSKAVHNSYYTPYRYATPRLGRQLVLPICQGLNGLYV